MFIYDIVQALLDKFDTLLVSDLFIHDAQMVQWFSASLAAVTWILVIAFLLGVLATAFLGCCKVVFGGGSR